MIELPEARTIARDLRAEIVGKTVVAVGGDFTGHRFTFYSGDLDEYQRRLVGQRVDGIVDRNFYVEIVLGDCLLLLRDGANVRYFVPGDKRPAKSKLLLEFDDGSALNVTVAMYACIGLQDKDGEIDNKYYALEVDGVGAMDAAFTLDYFRGLLDEKTAKLSTKAFLATEQRILGIGNGVVQDILYNAKLNPRRKMNTLSEAEVEGLYAAVQSTLTAMIEQGGRDTEKNIYGEKGGYKTILCSKTYRAGCPACAGDIKKEQYLGGSIYYCPNCQK